MSPSIATITRETALVAFSGELDLAARPQAEAVLCDLLDAGTRELLVDFSDLTFLDVAGVAALVAAARRAEQCGARVYVVRAHGQARELMEWAGPVAYSLVARRRSARNAGGFASSACDAIAA